jgi:phage baseplate assembly protein W
VRLADGKVTMNDGVERIHQSIGMILGTARGERVMNPLFGSRLSELTFAPINVATYELAAFFVREALELWERRIVVQKVSATVDPAAPSVLLIHVSYLIKDTNTPGNMVYPYYLDQS